MLVFLSLASFFPPGLFPPSSLATYPLRSLARPLREPSHPASDRPGGPTPAHGASGAGTALHRRLSAEGGPLLRNPHGSMMGII